MEIIRCECGKPLPFSGWLYCQMCGKRVPNTEDKHLVSHFMNCWNCSFIIGKSDLYCVNCGNKNNYMELLKKEMNNGNPELLTKDYEDLVK
jgi:hypothetical protein